MPFLVIMAVFLLLVCPFPGNGHVAAGTDAGVTNIRDAGDRVPE